MISTIAQGIIKLQTNTYTPENLTTQAINLSPDFSIIAYMGKKGLAASSNFLTSLGKSSYISWLLVSPVPVLSQYPTKLQFHCNPEVTQEHSICTQQLCWCQLFFIYSYILLSDFISPLFIYAHKDFANQFFPHAFSSNTKYYQRPGNYFKK